MKCKAKKPQRFLRGNAGRIEPSRTFHFTLISLQLLLNFLVRNDERETNKTSSANLLTNVATDWRAVKHLAQRGRVVNELELQKNFSLSLY